MAKGRSSSTERRNLISELTVNLFDLAQQARGLAVQAEYLHLAVDSLSNRQHGFIDGATGDRQFLLNTAKQFKRHSWISLTSDKNYYVNS